MSKKILVLTGSPRKGGNSSAMADAFVKAAEAKGHEVTRFDCAFMNFKSCRACDTCFKTGRACSFQDDFEKIAPVLSEADAYVFVTPTYWYTIPSDLKIVFDKLYSFMLSGRRNEIENKETFLMACCEEEMSAMDGIKIVYEKTGAALNWNSLGELLVPGTSAKGDIENTDALSRAAAMAELL